MPGPLTMLKVIVRPLVALTKPVPGLTFTCAVSVCVPLTSLVAWNGLIWMFAST